MLSKSQRESLTEEIKREPTNPDSSLPRISKEDLKKILDQMRRFNLPETCLNLLKFSLSTKKIIMMNADFTINELKFFRALGFADIPLEMVNLTGSKLGSLGMEYLLEGVKNHKSLKILALSNCKIEYYRADLEKAITIFNTIPSLKKVDLSFNFLSNDCDSFLDDDRSLISSRSSLQLIPSLTNPREWISNDRWIISFACKKDDSNGTSGLGHAFIMLEGMRENGQLFLEKYHIVPDKSYGGPLLRSLIPVRYKATVKNGRINPFEYDNKNYYSQKFVIDNTTGETFLKMVNERLGTKVDFNLLSDSSFSRGEGVFNCVSWCISVLKEIGLKLNFTVFETPERVARGKRFY